MLVLFPSLLQHPKIIDQTCNCDQSRPMALLYLRNLLMTSVSSICKNITHQFRSACGVLGFRVLLLVGASLSDTSTLPSCEPASKHFKRGCRRVVWRWRLVIHSASSGSSSAAGIASSCSCLHENLRRRRFEAGSRRLAVVRVSYGYLGIGDVLCGVGRRRVRLPPVRQTQGAERFTFGAVTLAL